MSVHIERENNSWTQIVCYIKIIDKKCSEDTYSKHERYLKHWTMQVSVFFFIYFIFTYISSASSLKGEDDATCKPRPVVIKPDIAGVMVLTSSVVVYRCLGHNESYSGDKRCVSLDDGVNVTHKLQVLRNNEISIAMYHDVNQLNCGMGCACENLHGSFKCAKKRLSYLVHIKLFSLGFDRPKEKLRPEFINPDGPSYKELSVRTSGKSWFFLDPTPPGKSDVLST